MQIARGEFLEARKKVRANVWNGESVFRPEAVRYDPRPSRNVEDKLSVTVKTTSKTPRNKLKEERLNQLMETLEAKEKRETRSSEKDRLKGRRRYLIGTALMVKEQRLPACSRTVEQEEAIAEHGFQATKQIKHPRDSKTPEAPRRPQKSWAAPKEAEKLL